MGFVLVFWIIALSVKKLTLVQLVRLIIFLMFKESAIFVMFLCLIVLTALAIVPAKVVRKLILWMRVSVVLCVLTKCLTA